MSKFCSKKRYLKLLLIIFFTTSYFLLSKDLFEETKNNDGNEPRNDKYNKKNFGSIPEAKIDEDGVYKYVQIKCNKSNIFIRGSKRFEYHKDIYEDFLEEVEKNGLDKNSCDALGGGRINKNEKKKKLKIYGYSKTFGRVEGQHEKTKNILQKYYPEYKITWTNKGY